MIERKKFCPVCGELVAVWQGDEAKYGDKAVWNWYQFIRMKYDCDECRNIIKGQSNRLADKRYRENRKKERNVLLDVVEAYRAEAQASRRCVAELEARRR